MNKLRSIYSSAWSAILTIIAVTAITIVGDLNTDFKNWLASFTGHHWVTKSWLSLIIFIVLFIVFRAIAKDVSETKLKTSLLVLQLVTLLGFAALLGFYLFEFLH